MDIEAVSGAAGIAIACALIFLLAAKTWQRLSTIVSGHPSFADSIMSEAAQRFRDFEVLVVNDGGVEDSHASVVASAAARLAAAASLPHVETVRLVHDQSSLSITVAGRPACRGIRLNRRSSSFRIIHWSPRRSPSRPWTHMTRTRSAEMPSSSAA